jgi:hypothetical protein
MARIYLIQCATNDGPGHSTVTFEFAYRQRARPTLDTRSSRESAL